MVPEFSVGYKFISLYYSPKRNIMYIRHDDGKTEIIRKQGCYDKSLFKRVDNITSKVIPKYSV